MNQIAKSAIIITFFSTFSLGLAFLSNMVIASKFGAGRDMDVFWAATSLPLFITNILSSSLNFAFIPVFAEYRTKKNIEIWKVVSSFINLNVIATTGLCLIGILFARHIMYFLVPGFTEEKLVMSAELLRWLFPIIIFTVINELLISVCFSNKKFLLPSVNKIISPAITIIFVILFHSFIGTKSIIFAMLAATLIQTAFLIIGFWGSKDFIYLFILDHKHPGVKKILKLMIPLILGMILYRAVPITDRFFLSGLPEGSISHIGYAFMLLSAIPPIIASGISVSIFPLMSQYAAEEKWSELKEIMSKGIRMLFFLSLPFVFILGPFCKPLIQLFFERGAFTSADTTAVYYAFAVYLLALPSSVVGTIISQGFYVLKYNNIIATIGVIMVGLYIVFCMTLIKPLSYLAIPVSYAIYHNCALFTTNVFIRKKLGKFNWPPMIYMILISMLIGVAIFLILYFLTKFQRNNLFITIISLIAGFLVYFLAGKLVFHLEEANAIWETFLTRYKRS